MRKGTKRFAVLLTTLLLAGCGAGQTEQQTAGETASGVTEAMSPAEEGAVDAAAESAEAGADGEAATEAPADDATQGGDTGTADADAEKFAEALDYLYGGHGKEEKYQKAIGLFTELADFGEGKLAGDACYYLAKNNVWNTDEAAQEQVTETLEKGRSLGSGLCAYLLGEREERNNHYSMAEELYQEAIDKDCLAGYLGLVRLMEMDVLDVDGDRLDTMVEYLDMVLQDDEPDILLKAYSELLYGYGKGYEPWTQDVAKASAYMEQLRALADDYEYVQDSMEYYEKDYGNLTDYSTIEVADDSEMVPTGEVATEAQVRNYLKANGWGINWTYPDYELTQENGYYLHNFYEHPDDHDHGGAEHIYDDKVQDYMKELSGVTDAEEMVLASTDTVNAANEGTDSTAGDAAETAAAADDKDAAADEIAETGSGTDTADAVAVANSDETADSNTTGNSAGDTGSTAATVAGSADAAASKEAEQDPVKEAAALVADGDYSGALAKYMEAAESGDADAMYEVGRLYYSERYGMQDVREALSWYEKAATAGSTDAMRDLGVKYAYGIAVEKDTNKATEWLAKAKDAGDKHAETLLAAINGGTK